jgi:hypothetical protein
MADGQPQRAGEPGPPVLTPRLVAAAALLAVALVGLRAALPAASWDSGPWRADGVPLGLGLELVLIALVTAAELRQRRSPQARQPIAGLRVVLRTVLYAGVLAVPILLAVDLISHFKPHGHARLTAPPAIAPRRPLHGTPAHGGFSGAPLLYTFLVLLLLAALAASILLLRRRARAIAWRKRFEVPDDEPADQLRRAVRSGQAALLEIDDARLAIIACYVAMERSLARAGTIRAAAETPDELLARAAQDGLVRGGAAGRLTELFYEARFSTHPVPPGRRAEAQQALGTLAAHLDEADGFSAPAARAAGAAAGPAAGANGTRANGTRANGTGANGTAP